MSRLLSACTGLALFLSLAGCQRDVGALRSPLAPLGLHTKAAPAADVAPAAPPVDTAPRAVIVHGTPLQPMLGTPGAASDLPERRDIQISFTDAALKTVVDTLLGDILNLPYTYDTRVQGTVSLHTGRQMSSSEVLRLLETLLRMNGAALVRSDNLYRVVPLAEARGGAPAAGGGPGYAVSALPLRYVSAATMQQLLEPIYQASGQVQVETGLNLLLVIGTADERRAIIEAARGFDVDWMAGRSVGIFPLAQSRPEPVIRELETIFAAADKGVAAGAVTFVPVQRLNGVLAVANAPSIIDKVSAWIARLDHGTANQRNLFVYYVQHAKARDVARLLSRLFDGGGAEPEAATPARVTPPGRPTLTLESTGDAAAAGGLAAPATANQMPSLLSARPSAAVDIGSETQPPTGVRIIADAQSNSLVILAFPQEYRLIEQALQRIDVAPQQVLIEATIAEVTLNDRLRYGVQTYLKSDSGDVQGGFTLAPQGLRPLTQTPGFNLLVSRYGDPRGVLTALDEITDVKVVSSPQLVVMDNQEAQLQVGDRVPVITRQAVSTDNPNAPVVNSVEYQNTGVILRVTPRINSGGMVTMDIQQEVSSVSRSANTGALTPTISRRAIESNVSIRSGQTVVLGGLISDQQTVGSSGIPGLSRIPVLGALFGEKTNGLQRTELIVFITPRVVKNPDDAEAVTQELMRRLRGLAPVSGATRTDADR